MISFSEFLSYFSYTYVRYALLVGVLVALCASLLGVVLVLKRYSYLGDGLSHVAFGATALATAINLADSLAVVMPVTVLVAVLLLGRGEGRRINGDAALAMLSVGSLAIGYILLNLFPSSSNIAADVCSSLFGSSSILTLGQRDVALTVIMSAVVTAVFVLFYNRIFALTFDPSFMQATGGGARSFNLILSVLCAIVISLSMRLVGSLLVSALIIFPSMCAMSLFRSFRSVMISSAVIGITCAALGLLASMALGTPTGASIVVCDIAAFALCRAVGKK